MTVATRQGVDVVELAPAAGPHDQVRWAVIDGDLRVERLDPGPPWTLDELRALTLALGEVASAR